MESNNYNSQDLIKNPSFINWVKGKATEDERRFWDGWVMENPSNRSVALKAMQEIAGFTIAPSENTSTRKAWNALLNRIEKENEPGIHRVLKKKRARANSLIRFACVAAVALLAFFSVYMSMHFYHTPLEALDVSEIVREELDTDFGVQKKVGFSDGSEIILNGNSRMVITKNSDNPSVIDLYLAGEAYFFISKTEALGDSPFHIHTDDGKIKVLGTQLVVSTRNNQTQVFLETGSISVSPFHLDAETILFPGQFVGFDNKMELLEARIVNPEIYTSWINRRLHFDQASVKEVLQRIEDTFGIRAEAADSTVFKHKISGSIESSELETITSALSEILNISVEKSESDNVIYIGSTLD